VVAASKGAYPRNVPILGRLVLSWTFVGIPLAWGVYATAAKAVALFQ
jgi:hypothetical protein